VYSLVTIWILAPSVQPEYRKEVAVIQNFKTILNAHIAAFETTRQEAGKVIELAIKKSQKLRERARDQADGVVENLAGAADDQLTAFEQGMGRMIRRIGLPTAKDVNALTRRVEALATKVEARTRNVKKAGRRTAARRAA
jgi:polyhydroxyalkanoate synthesis regulator phasin